MDHVRARSRAWFTTGTSCLALLVSGAVYGQATQSGEPEVLEEIIITGSYIKGSSTTGALPIDVVGRTDIENLGAPTTADIVNNLTMSQNVIKKTMS